MTVRVKHCMTLHENSHLFIQHVLLSFLSFFFTKLRQLHMVGRFPGFWWEANQSSMEIAFTLDSHILFLLAKLGHKCSRQQCLPGAPCKVSITFSSGPSFSQQTKATSKNHLLNPGLNVVIHLELRYSATLDTDRRKESEPLAIYIYQSSR